jgi:DNA-binding NarL/FixJ family response regulator
MNVFSVNKSIVNIALAHIFEQLQDINLHFYETINDNDDHFKILVDRQLKYVVFLDEKYDRSYINKALNHQSIGFMTLDLTLNNVIECLKAFENNEIYVPDQVSQLLIKNHTKIINFELSERESEILDYLSKGKTLQEIGEQLFLSKNTVVTHKRNILKKTGFNKMTQLIAWWITQ